MKYAMSDMLGNLLQITNIQETINTIEVDGLVNFYKITKNYHNVQKTIKELISKGLMEKSKIDYPFKDVENTLDLFHKTISNKLGNDALEIIDVEIENMEKDEKLTLELLGNIMVIYKYVIPKSVLNNKDLIKNIFL